MGNQSGEADWGAIGCAAFFVVLVICITYANVKDSDRQHEMEIKRLEIEAREAGK